MRKSPPPAASPLPESGAKRGGRSGEGTASLLAQLIDDHRADATMWAAPPIEAPDESEPRFDTGNGDLVP